MHQEDNSATQEPVQAATTACLLIAETPLCFGQHSMQLQEPLILIISQPSCSAPAQLLLGMDLLQHRQAHMALTANSLTCTQLLLPQKLVSPKCVITESLLVPATACPLPAVRHPSACTS